MASLKEDDDLPGLESDDDMPDLESVGSSEYSDEDVDESSKKSKDASSKTTDKDSGQQLEEGPILKHDHSYIRHWLYDYVSEHIKVSARRIKIQLLSPCLYGTFSLDDKWINWIYEAGLIQSKSDFPTHALGDKELLAVEAIERAANEASPFLDCWPREEKGLFAKLVDAVDPCHTLREVMQVVRECSWFMERLPKIIPPSWKKDKPPQTNFFETAFVYSIVNTVKKSGNVDTDGDLDDESTLKASEKFRIEGNKLYGEMSYESAAKQYGMAINLCPFAHEAYGNRAITYLKMGDFRAAISDGYRCIVLNPDGWKGYSRYSCALYGMGDTVKAECIHRELLSAFPKQKGAIRLEWDKCLDIVAEKLSKTKVASRKMDRSMKGDDSVSNSEAKKEDKLKKKQGKAKKLEAQKKLEQQLKQIDVHLATGSERMQHSRVEDVVEEYGNAVKLIAALKGKWQESKGGESNRILATILYLQAKAKIESGGAVLDAMGELQTVQHKHSFPAVHFELAQCHIQLNRFKDAERELYQGLTQMPIYHKNFSPFFWPGLNNLPIDDLRPHVLENKMRQLREFCVPRGRPDAVCRFSGCQQQNHLTTSIYFDELDTKGYASIVCSEGCWTPMHYDCWRKKREELVITSDKDMMAQPCLTSDCDGIVIEVRIADSGGVKYRTQHSEQRESKRPRIVKENRFTITSAAHQERVERKRREWREKKGERKARKLLQEGEVSSEEDTGKRSPVAEKHLVENGGNQEEALDEFEVGSPKKDSRLGSEMLLRRGGKSASNEDKKDGKARNVRKKKSKVEEKSASSVVDLAQLFTTTHEGRNTISANDEIDHSGNVVPADMGPEQPFARPSHMEEDLQQFEKKEAPRLGFKPDVRRATSTAAVASATVVNATPGEESLLIYFTDVLKERGPLEVNDQTLQDALNYLPDESKCIIEKRGGLVNFLRLSPNIATHGKLVCLKEDSLAVAESMHQGNDYRGEKEKVPSGESKKGWAEKVKNKAKNRAAVSSPVSCETEDVDMFGSMFSSSQESVSATHPVEEEGIKDMPVLSQPGPETPHYDALFCDTDSQHSTQSLSPEMAEVPAVPPPKMAPSRVVKKEKGIQTDRIKKVDFAVSTDLLPQDSHRQVQMYENARRERDRLSLRVRDLEDEKVKLKRSLNVEIEKTVKSAKEEVKVEMDESLNKARMQLAEEQRRFEREKKEKQDQLKAANKENKALSEKLEKSKKEVLQCRQELDQQSLFHSRELERVSKEKTAVEERLKVAHNTAQRARERAVDAELCLLQVQGEMKVKELEGLIREADVLSEATQSNEWKGYRTNLKEILDAYKATIDGQLHDIQQGKEYANLDKAAPELPPKPAMPAVNPLALRQIQQMRQIQLMQAQAMKAQGQVGGIPLMMPGGIRQPINPGGVAKLVPQPVGSPQGPTTGLRPLIPVSDAGAMVQQLPVAKVMEGAKSGVERIWELLQSDYPNLERDRLRSILREIRKENGNTLQSLSVDVIAQKVREKLGDSKGAQEASTPSSQPSTTVVSAGTVSEPVSSAPPVFPSAYPMVPSQPSKQPQVVVTSAVGAPSVLLPMARQASMLNYMSLRQQQQPVPNQPQLGAIPQVSQAPRQLEAQPTALPQGAFPLHQPSPMQEPSATLPSAQIRMQPPIGRATSAPLVPGSFHPQPVLIQPMTASALQKPSMDPKLMQVAVTLPQQPQPTLPQQQPVNLPLQAPIRRPVAVAPPPKQRPAEPLVYGEDECVICAEDMEEFDTLHLDCGHKFHDKCIRTWLNEQSTCPTCRDHVLLQEDFPEL